MAKTKSTSGLGRGFDSLLPGNFDSSILLDEQDRVQKVLIDDIIPNQQQPRRHFDEVALMELSDSIKAHGILQPLVVTFENSSGKYMIVAGERRWRAAKKAGLSHVPAAVRTAQELEQLEIALVENVQRVDLSPLEQANSIQKLHDQFSVSYEDISKRLGKASTTVLNIVRLLKLSPKASEALRNNHITEGHARAVLALKNANKQDELVDLIIKNHWSVRQAEQYASAHKKGAKSPLAQKNTLSTTAETKKLSNYLKADVSIRRLAAGGKLEIRFKSDDELNQIIDKIAG